MSDINEMMNKYKVRKQASGQFQAGKTPNMNGRRIMGNEELTGAIYQLSGIVEILAQSKQTESKRYNEILDVIFEVEMKIHALTKALCDAEIISFEKIDEAKTKLEKDYSDQMELQYDTNNFLVLVDRACQEGDAVIVGVRVSINGVLSKELSTDKFFTPKLGSGDLIPVIESQIIGMKAGESKDFSFVIDENLGKNQKYRLSPWIGQEISCSINLFKVKEKRLPELKNQPEEVISSVPVELATDNPA